MSNEQIKAPEPVFEDVVDVDFMFLGGQATQLTLRPQLDHSFEIKEDEVLVQMGAEFIIVERRNLLYLSTRERRMEIRPPKPVKPSEAPATPPSKE